MCGISGVFNYSNRNIVSKNIIEKINDLQKDRGPDGNGLWQSDCKKITLGHTRLSIIDLTENANQPFLTEDKNYVITFNGEIYNYAEIKKKLQGENVRFISDSDTEVILQSYKFWGLKFTKYLRGMFSFAIYDKRKKELILVRDPFGIKPLYYVKSGNVIYFASQIKSLLSINHIKFTLSNAGICSYYVWGHLQEPFTLYKEIKSLKKGSILTINSNGIEKTINYASIKNSILNTKGIHIKNNDDASSYLRNTLNESVKFHNISDVPITCLLSSGIDSNVLITSAASQNLNNFDALTLDFGFSGEENENKLASATSKLNQVKHSIKKFSNKEIQELMKDFFKKMDSPTVDGFNNFLISNQVNQNKKKVMISGVGGDEIFFGYPSFKRIPKIYNLFKFIPNINIKNPKSIINLLNKIKINPKFFGLLNYNSTYEKIFFLQRCSFMPEELEGIVDFNVLKSGLEELNVVENLKNDIKDFDNDSLLITYLETEYYLCSRLLRDADWATMSNSVEMRTPYVDWTFFNDLIPLLKSNIKINKHTLLDCYKEKLPKELYTRKKTGFSIPYKKYFDLSDNDKNEQSSSLKNWAIFSYNSYIKNNPLNQIK